MKAASILATLAGAAFGAWCVWKASMTGWAVPGSGTPTAPAGQHPPRVEPSGNTCRLDLKGSPVQQTQGFDYWYANQSDAWLSPFVIPSHRLVFCYVPKCGTSRWQTFLRWLVGVQDWASNPHNRDANGYIGGLMQLKHLPRAEAIQIMLDPSWTKMAVVRDPLDRLRSAYLDKIAGGNDPNNTHLTKDLFGLPYEAFNATNFPDFVTRVEFGMHHALEHENPHWQRQSPGRLAMLLKTGFFDFSRIFSNVGLKGSNSPGLVHVIWASSFPSTSMFSSWPLTSPCGQSCPTAL